MKNWFSNVIFSFAWLSLSALSWGKDSGAHSVDLSLIVTAQSSGSQEAMIVSGGSWWTHRKLIHAAVLIKHPKGEFLWDTGIGAQIKDQMEAFGLLEKQIFSIENVRPAREQLLAQQYDIDRLMAIIPSHLHWDHASGIEDFLGVPVWLQKAEYDEAMLAEPPSFLRSQFDSPDIEWRYLQLKPLAFQNFDSSYDIFGDGSAVLVDLSGHTAGQLGLFARALNGQTYFFVGDTVWSIKGVIDNRPRPSFVDWVAKVDSNFEKNSAVIAKIHQLTKQWPELIVIPAHDETLMDRLPVYPQSFSSLDNTPAGAP